MKKRLLLILSLLIVSSFVLSACRIPFVDVVRGSGDMVTETRQVSPFSALTLNGAGRLIVVQGSSESLEIEAEDNIIGELTSDVNGDTLILGFQSRPWRKQLLPTRSINYYLTVKDLSEITFNGAGDFEIESLSTDTLNVVINGAGQIKIENLAAEDLSINISGTAAIDVSGQVTTQMISIEGAGNYQAEDLLAQFTEIKIAGLGNATVWTSETLDIVIDGGGSVNYYGSPNITQEINGLGDINNRGEK
jgi:hypothetical protein